MGYFFKSVLVMSVIMFLLHFLNFVLFIYLKDREIFHLSSGSLHKCPLLAGLGQIESGSQELSLDLPCGSRKPMYLSHQLLLPGCVLAERCNQEQSKNLNPDTLKGDVDIPNSTSATAASAHSSIHFFNLVSKIRKVHPYPEYLGPLL